MTQTNNFRGGGRELQGFVYFLIEKGSNFLRFSGVALLN